jgi:hypothetical protein
MLGPHGEGLSDLLVDERGAAPYAAAMFRLELSILLDSLSLIPLLAKTYKLPTAPAVE